MSFLNEGGTGQTDRINTDRQEECNA